MTLLKMEYERAVAQQLIYMVREAGEQLDLCPKMEVPEGVVPQNQFFVYSEVNDEDDRALYRVTVERIFPKNVPEEGDLQAPLYEKAGKKVENGR